MSVEALSAVLSMNVGDSTRKLVLIGLANHAHKDGTAAYAGVSTLAEYANCSTRTVQRHLAKLLEDGFIREGDQTVIDPRIPARYRPIAYEVAMTMDVVEQWAEDRMPGLRDVSAAHGEVGGARSAQVRRGDNLSPLTGAPLDSAFPQVIRGDNVTPLVRPVSDASGVTPVTFRGDTGDVSGVTPVSPKPSIEPSKEPSKNPMPTADAAGGGDDLALIAFEAVPDPRPTFDDFWAVYPLHTGKIAARRVWDRVVAKGTDPQEIVDGATRYANDPNLPVDKSKIKYPQGWLNDGRWMDGPLPARLGDRPQRVQYNDALTWGDEEHRKSIAEARRNMTQAEIDAAVAEAFGDDEQH